MPMRRIFAGTILTAALLAAGAAGCGAQPGRTTVSWDPGSPPPPLVEATDDAIYALYEEKSTTPLWQTKLDEGDEYGFREGGDGEVVGYANGKEIRLPTGFTKTGYIWSMQKN